MSALPVRAHFACVNRMNQSARREFREKIFCPGQSRDLCEFRPCTNRLQTKAIVAPVARGSSIHGFDENISPGNFRRSTLVSMATAFGLVV
jgi:hypothetical protein